MKIFWVLAVAAAPLAAQADDSDPAAAYDLLQDGQILSLATILDMVRPMTHGNVLEVEIENPDHDLAYEVFYLDPDGSRHVIYVSARTGQVLPGKPGPVQP
ncbi:MAG: PepSY domain-containing protein [Paracoccaceae bacterium]